MLCRDLDIVVVPAVVGVPILDPQVGEVDLIIEVREVVFIGPRADFLVGPRAALAYLQGRGERYAGHNPLGGWSVLLLLSLLLAQAVSGLFNTDDVLFSGPFFYWADDGFRDAMGVVHDVVFNALLAMMALHIFAVCYYQLRRKQKLVQAMVSGSARSVPIGPSR